MPLLGLQSSSQKIPSYGAVKEYEILIGVCAHPYDARTPYFEVDRYFDLMKDVGVKWIRVGMTDPRWYLEFEPFVEQTHARGIKVLATLGGWVVGENPNFTLADWEDAIHAVMEIFADRVDAWKVWNEPNVPSFYLGYMDGSPEHYVDMLKSAYEIIKTYRPDVPVIFAGVAPIENCTHFTSKCWELGAADYCDAFSFHLYAIYQDSWLAQTVLITDPKSLWITETGANSLQYGLEGQATQLGVLRTYFKENMEAYRIQKVFWYCWMDYAKPGDATNVFGHPTSREDLFGLVTVDLKAKPAYRRYQS